MPNASAETVLILRGLQALAARLYGQIRELETLAAQQLGIDPGANDSSEDWFEWVRDALSGGCTIETLVKNVAESQESEEMER